MSAPRCPLSGDCDVEATTCVGCHAGRRTPLRFHVCDRHAALLRATPVVGTLFGMLAIVGMHPLVAPQCRHPHAYWQNAACRIVLAGDTPRVPQAGAEGAA